MRYRPKLNSNGEQARQFRVQKQKGSHSVLPGLGPS
jgi:hypothetical protein